MSNPRIQLRHDTASNWSTVNPVLLAGEVGIESDTKDIKIGDGETSWNDLTGVLSNKQDKLFAGEGINIQLINPDAVIPDYHAMNSSQQYVPYSVADPTAWVSTRLQNPRGIAITDTLDNIASKAFEYVALVPYVDGAGLSLKLSWDSNFSIINYTDGLFIHAASTDPSLTSGQFCIQGAYFKNTNNISLTNEQYAQIQQQGGIWFKIISDGAGNYNSYYSFDNDTWVEIIFNDNSKFSPEHTPERPCIGCLNEYTQTTTFNLEAASFSFTPARDPQLTISAKATEILSSISGFSSTGTLVLKCINGVIQWVTET